MADKKISALTASSTPLAGTEVLPIVQGGSTVKVSVANLTAGRPVSASALGVGVTNTSNNIHVDIPFGGASNPVMLQNSAATVDGRGSDIVFRSSGTDYAVIRGLTQTDSTSGRLFFYTASSGTLNLQMSLDKFGNVTADTGNFVLGTAGKGIDFSANTPAAGMTSELLDWYEEGTWTPTDASGAGLSFVAVSGNYTRIGNTVFLFGYVRYPVTATTNTARIGGLPFTANSADSVAQGAVTYSQVATIRSVGVAKSTAILDVYTLAGGVPTNADLSNTVLYFNATYFV